MKNFNEELFLDLCKKYGVEVIEGKGRNVLVDDGVEKEITPEILREVLTGKPCTNLEKEPVVSKKDKTIVLSTLRLNPNEKLVESIKKGTEKKGGYCPCLVFKNEESICPFYAREEYPEEVSIDEVCIYSQKNLDVAREGCHCTLYVPKEVSK